MNELVSIVIPTYKRPWHYLERALKTVQAQTYKNIEIVVVDDSPDSYELRPDIAAHMEALKAADPRVVYVVNAVNLGGSLARNEGIKAATGDYIAFLDDDDEFLPDKVAHQLQFMLDTDCDLSFESMIMHNPKGEVVDVREFHDIESFDNAYLLGYHLMRHMTGTSTFMFKAEPLRRIGGFDDMKMGQEFRLMLKAIEQGLKVRYLAVCDVFVAKHQDGSISQGNNKIVGEQALYAFKKGYFDRLTRKQRMYIRFRHYAVMVVAYLRNRMYARAAGAGAMAFFVSPLDFCMEVFGFFWRIGKKRMEG